MKQTTYDGKSRAFALMLAAGSGLLILGSAGYAAPLHPASAARVRGAAMKSGAILGKGSHTKPRAVNVPVAAAGYTLTVFATAPTGFTSPDSIAVDSGHVFVGYGDKGVKTGGGTSTVAEFTSGGTLLQTFTLAGHNDGLKVDPATHLLWAMQNEDGSPQLVILDPANPAGANVYPLTALNGGGYDDIVFRGRNVYFSASNPANNPNTDPAIVQATLANGAFTLTPVLAGNAAATNTLTGAPTTLNLQDPDSLTLTPAGDLLLDSQADDELVTINATTSAVTVLPITVASGNPAQKSSDIDDTVFAKSASDILLVADRDSGTVYSVTGLATGQAYSASDVNNLVGTLDQSKGIVTPIVTNLNSPHGMAILHAPPVAAAGYTLSVFAAAPTGFTGPDSIAVDSGHVFVGYGDAGIKTGGGTSTVAEFTNGGALLQTFTLAGHNDGLKVDPATHLLWAMQNEDGSPQLVILDPANPAGANVYPLTALNGGGYDDIVFLGGSAYFSASNPANNPNTDPAIVKAVFANNAFTLTPFLFGNAPATNTLTGTTGPLNLQDPDSLTLTPTGDFLLDSQADDELVTINATTSAVTVLPITVKSGNPAQTASDIDDTVFAKSAADILLIADRDSGTVYAVTGLAAGQPYSASDVNNLVGTLDFKTGIVAPIVTNLNSPHGMAILPVLGSFSAGLQMISAPEDFTGIGLSAALGFVNPKLAVWDPANAQYLYSPTAPADTFHPGQGYWARLANTLPLIDQGVPTAATAPFSISLTAGWNMIGDPFPATVALSGLQVQDSTGKSFTDLNAASQAGLVSPILYSYSPGDAAYPGNYQPQTLTSGVLTPLKGYWIRAFQNCKLIVPVPTGH